ncbi:ROK family protein [Angustibacter sp. McL0619]|uniref:ROK family protein n=1 Tax=Angustibacter sp. McL0619 TaxID=3415676 RepID=UPI003CF94642
MSSSLPAGAPAATDRLRRDNSALLLRSLRDDGPASRAALAQRTGLAKATVSTIVADLVAAGAVRDGAAQPEVAATGRSGRPGRPVTLAGSHPVGLGLEVNVGYLAATALDLSGQVVLSTQVPLAAEQSGLARLVALARDSVDRLATDGRKVLGVTVAVPGQVDLGTGRVIDAPNLQWHDRDVAAVLTQALGETSVLVDNDANCAAAGESAFGAARGIADLLYLTGTVGIGAGLVVGGQVRRGAHGLAGEVGHAPLGEPGRRCVCGRSGCWETAIGLRALLRETGTEQDLDGRDPVAVAIEIAARCAVDDTVQAGVGRLARSLATGLATLAATLDPQLIVLGGSFVPLGPWLLPVVTRELDAVSSCRVELSTLGLHAASTGAAAAVLGDVYAGTLALD